MRGKRYTLGEIARGSEPISRTEITRVFNGSRRPSIGLAQRIAGFLGVSIDQLMQFLNKPAL